MRCMHILRRMATDDLRTWAKNALGLAGTPDAHLTFDQAEQIERAMEHADHEPRTSYRAYDGFTFRDTYQPTENQPHD